MRIVARAIVTTKRRLEQLKKDRMLASERLRFYSQFVQRGYLCFDIGANLGNRTDPFLRLGARVVAVEPQDWCIQQLRARYHKNPNVTLVQKAIGETEGNAQLILSDAHTISSMSNEWITAVRASGRFADHQWGPSVTVPVTTLDQLIREYGMPDFCKIDVEGFESQVLRGLSNPISAVSFEFTPEYFESCLECIDHLLRLGYREFNYSLGESMILASEEWVDSTKLVGLLMKLDSRSGGDVYARLHNKERTLKKRKARTLDLLKLVPILI